MNWLKELSANKNLHTNLSAFLNQYDEVGQTVRKPLGGDIRNSNVEL